MDHVNKDPHFIGNKPYEEGDLLAAWRRGSLGQIEVTRQAEAPQRISETAEACLRCERLFPGRPSSPQRSRSVSSRAALVSPLAPETARDAASPHPSPRPGFSHSCTRATRASSLRCSSRPHESEYGAIDSPAFRRSRSGSKERSPLHRAESEGPERGWGILASGEDLMPGSSPNEARGGCTILRGLPLRLRGGNPSGFRCQRHLRKE